MGKAKKSNSKKPQSGPREVTPEVRQDKVAANLLSFKKPEYDRVSRNNKTRDRGIAKGKVPVKKRKERVYTEKELGIPKLNTALDPVGVKVKGKKGKKFVNDTSMQLILAEVQQESNEVTASKLERARQLEAIREAKRREIEEREEQQKAKVELKKKELKKGKKSSSKQKPADNGFSDSAAPSSKGKKRVSFAV